MHKPVDCGKRRAKERAQGDRLGVLRRRRPAGLPAGPNGTTPSPYGGWCAGPGGGCAWVGHLLSALGLYPLVPGALEYSIGSPMYRHVRLTLDSGNVLEVKAPAKTLISQRRKCKAICYDRVSPLKCWMNNLPDQCCTCS